MRRWQNLAAPDDPGSWQDCVNMWPTNRGTYRRVVVAAGESISASGAGTVRYAFAAATLAGVVEYVVDSSKIWQYSASTLTDRTGGVTIGTYPMMAQYGSVTICVMGAANPTVKATGGNFSALAGAPQGEIIAVCSNAVGVFNTSTDADGYAISDVGDYTNWTTGEAVTGRLIATPGPILAAVAFGDSFIVFKPTSVYRMRYVGGAVKWVSEVLHTTRGVGASAQAPTTITYEKYEACANALGVLFISQRDNTTTTAAADAWWMDGAGQFRNVSPLTAIYSVGSHFFIGYSSYADLFYLYHTTLNNSLFYSPTVDAWGYAAAPSSGSNGTKPVMGIGATGTTLSGMPTAYYKEAANNLTRYSTGSSVTGISCSVTTSMYGVPDRKTKWTRVVPILRVRSSLGGSPSATMGLTTYRERHNTSAVTNTTISESSFRNRFDFTAAENFARFSPTYLDLDVEIDDVLVMSVPAGSE